MSQISTKSLIIKIPTEENTTDPEVIEIALQDTETVEENGLVCIVDKPAPNSKLEEAKQIFQSLVHALRWSQLKRQLNQATLLAMTQRHKRKIVVGVGVLTLYMGGSLYYQQDTPSYDDQYLAATASLTPLSTTVLPTSNSNQAVSSEAQENYIARFAEVAQAEMQKFGVPASITLGLAIAHSNFGTSAIAQTGHNHFGITCSDNHLAEGITGQQTVGKECYSQYENAWTSFRANSLLLTSGNLATVKEAAQLDYHIWVSGLEKIKFPKADQLHQIITKYSLAEFDRLPAE
jgi:flagellum-specific peptidoglycan hydrolase FlgJ